MEVAQLDVHGAAVHLEDLAKSQEGALLQVHAEGLWADIWPAVLLDNGPEVPIKDFGFSCHQAKGGWKDTAVSSKHKENVELEREMVNSQVIIFANV